MSTPNSKVCLVVLLAYIHCQESNLYCLCCHCHDLAMKSTASKEGAKMLKKIVEKQMSVFAGVDLGLQKKTRTLLVSHVVKRIMF